MSCNEKAEELVKEFWHWRLDNSPEFATFCGIHDYDDKLEVYTLDAIEDRKVKCKKFLSECSHIMSESGLKEELKANLEFLATQLQTYLSCIDYKGYFFPINHMEGVHFEFETLIDSMKKKTVDDFNKILARYKKFPDLVSQIVNMMKEGIKNKMTLHKVSVESIPCQIDCGKQMESLEQNREENIWFKPFASLPDDVPADKKEALQSEAVELISNNVIPALKMLKEFIQNEYLEACRPDPGINSLPNGAEYYQACLDFHLSFHMSPEEVHNIGRNEVKRITKEMETVIKSLNENLSVKDMANKMRNDDAFYYDTSEEVLDSYEKLIRNKIYQLVERIFCKIPQAKIAIQPMPACKCGGPAAFYLCGNIDGSRPGIFYVNCADVKCAPKYDQVALALHEGVPGHHLQGSYLLEMEECSNVQKFMEDRKYSEAPSRFPLNTAYLEGWGLYSEFLGEELGLYEDPYDKFGRLSQEMTRAVRLVVDTGIHALGWSAEKAVNYMLDNTACSKRICENEINRYITWPGQACAYKIGELKIKSLRAKAEKALGEKFDVKEFHDVVLQNYGPLNMLEQKVMQFMKSKA